MPVKTVYANKSGHWASKSAQWSKTPASSGTARLTAGTDGSANYYMAYWGWNNTSLGLLANQFYQTASLTLRCGETAHTGYGHPIYRLTRNADLITGSTSPTPYCGNDVGWLHNGYSTSNDNRVWQMVADWVSNPANAHGVVSDYPLKYYPHHSTLWGHSYAYVSITYVVDNPPTTPGVFTSPTAGQVVDNSVTASWGASTDPEGDPITYYVYADNVSEVWYVGATSSTSITLDTTGWPETTSMRLYVVAGAAGLFSADRYSPYFTIKHNTAPTITPSTLSGTIFTTASPTLTARITDPDSGQTLSTTFEIASDSSFTSNKQTRAAGNLSSPRSDTLRSVTALPALTDGRWYWRARVYDGQIYSSWTPTRYFDVNLNTPPTITPTTPDGMVFSTTTPTLETRVTDPDTGQTLTVEYEITIAGAP